MPIVRRLLILLAAVLSTHGAHAATLGGVVTRAADQAPVAGAGVLALTSDAAQVVAFGSTGANGQYALTVPAGSYLVFANANGLVPELFDDVPCTADTCDTGAATAITVAAAASRTDLHFALATRGTVQGRVLRADTAAPLADVTVTATALGGEGDASATTDAEGRYTLAVTPGPRRIATRNAQGFIDELHADVPCPAGICDGAAATPVSVPAGGTLTGIDFALARGGRIAGHVTRVGGQPIDDASVEVRVARAGGGLTVPASVGADGAWQVDTGLPAGSYRAVASASSRYAPRVWNDHACPGDDVAQCDLDAGNAIAVVAGNVASAIDFALPRTSGVLAGRVTRLADGQGFEGVQVSARRADGLLLQAASDGSGQWRIDDVPAGSYTVQADPPLGSPERGERWPGLQCEFPGQCPAGTPVVLATATERLDLDFRLAPLAVVQLTLRNADTGAPMRGEFRLRLPASGELRTVFANAPAAVAVPVTDGGALRFAGGSAACGPAGDRACIAERFPDDPCPNLGCTLAEGAALDVPKGGSASAELLLGAGARISGRVVETGGAPIDGLPIEVLDCNAVVVGAASTSGGDYAADGLPAGTYFVRTRAPSQFVDQIWDGRPCAGGACAPATGTPIALAPGQARPGIDFTLARGGGLSGQVRSELGGQPIAGASIAIHAAGVRVASATSAADGRWISPVLADGAYTVVIEAAGFDAEVYDNVPCAAAGCDAALGTPLTVAAPVTLTGVDAVLAPAAGAIVPRRLFLNRCAGGCSVTPGIDDSRTNRSSLVNGPRTLPAFAGGDAAFATLAGCVRAAFGSHNVDVLTDAPGNLPHWELMVGGTPGALGLSSGVLGIAPWAGGSLINNAIAFVFSASHGDDAFGLCWTAAHEAGHLMGLDHQILADDYMSYLDSTRKLFVDADAPCGTFAPRTCDFGGDVQNAFRRLALTVGFRPQLFIDGFEPFAPAAAARAAGQPPRPLVCGTDTRRTTLPAAIFRMPGGPTRAAPRAP